MGLFELGHARAMHLLCTLMAFFNLVFVIKISQYTCMANIMPKLKFIKKTFWNGEIHRWNSAVTFLEST